jgi:hypothetical protein
MDRESVADLCDAIRELNTPTHPGVDLLSTENALWRIAANLENVHKIISILDGIEDRLCEIRDEVSTLSIIQEARG